ncbi:MAG TPA: type II toxin-antitoxin system prevent-host-death family antitoxin [Candidatus Acidoferrum sp.]|nr:type II toxin-antitoxin system prevent-host-death family antitoxin [Candidatus Acidoferrum sp.]
MKDHSDRGTRTPPAKKSVGVRELKTHAARIVREVREARAAYLVTHRGRTVGVILPLAADGRPPSTEAADASTAWDAFLRAGRRLEGRFRPGTSGVRVLSKMRR